MIKAAVSFLFIVLLLASCGGGGSQAAGPPSLTWEAPTKRVDGTELNNLAGYRIYHGRSPRSYTETMTLPIESADCRNTGTVTECAKTISGLNPGVYYFAVTAYDTFGNESDYSNEVAKNVD